VFKRFGQYIIHRRWVLVAFNAATAAFLLVTAYFSMVTGQPWLAVLDTFMAGALVAFSLQTWWLPGLFEMYSETEREVMRAKMERDLHRAFDEFKKQHPEVNATLGPLEGPFREQ
jgi:hypothetical protein